MKQSKNKPWYWYPAHPKNQDATKMPGYHSSGLKTYKRVLPKLRDHRDVDIELLTEVMGAMVPKFDVNQLKLSHGLCEIEKIKFRYPNLSILLKNLQTEGFLDCDDFIRKSIEHRYNTKFQNKRYASRHGG